MLTPDEISENGGVSTVTAELTGASSQDVTVTVSSAGVSPATSSDFDQRGTTLTITAGQTDSTGTVTIAAEDNDMDGPNKQVTVTGTVAGPAGVSAPAARTLTITDDEGAPATKFEFSTMVMQEKDGQSEVSVSMNRAASELVTVKVQVKPESSADMDDFTLHGDSMLTIPIGRMESDGSLMVKAVDDSADNPNKQLMVVGSVMEGPDGVTPPTPMLLTITDDDDVPASTKVTLSVSPSRVTEDAGARDVTVTGTLDGAVLSTAMTVTVSVKGGTATADEDFASVSDFPLTIEADETSGSAIFTLTPTDDAAEEDDETVIVSGTTSDLTVDSATLRIVDDAEDEEASTKVRLSAQPAEVAEGAGATVVTVTGTLDGAMLDAATTVTVSVSGETATAGEDFAAVSDFPLTIEADEKSGSATFTLTPTDDTAQEDDETLMVSGTTSDLDVESATLTITDDDATAASTKVVLSVAPSEVAEGAGATAVTVTGTLDGAVLDAATTVTVSVSGETATAGEDFAAVSDLPLTIASEAKSGSATFTLTPKDDAFEEDDETLVVSGTTSDLAVDSATLRISRRRRRADSRRSSHVPERALHVHASRAPERPEDAGAARRRLGVGP